MCEESLGQPLFWIQRLPTCQEDFSWNKAPLSDNTMKVDVCVQEDMKQEPRWRTDSYWSWLVCAAAAISMAIVTGVNYSFGLLLPPLMERFGSSRQATAWVGALHLAIGHFLSPLGSYITDRFSYRFAAVLGSVAGVIGFFLASMSSQLWMMYLTYGCISGFGHITIFSSCSLVVLQYFVKRRSLAVGIVQSSPAIGMFGVTQITQALISAFGWQWTLRGFAALYFVCSLCSSVFVPLDSLKGRSNDNNLISNPKQKTTDNRGLLRNYSFLIFTTSLVILHIGYFVPTVHIIKHCKQELRIPEEESSMLFTYLAIASFFSRHFFCKIGDFRYLNRFHLYQGGMTISGLSVLCLPLARSFSSVAAVVIVFGLMEGSCLGQISLLVLECAGEDKVNQAWGYQMLFIGVSVLIGPPLAGLLADKLGSYTATFYTTGAVIIVGASITSLMAFVKQRPEELVETQSYDEELLVTEKVTVL